MLDCMECEAASEAELALASVTSTETAPPAGSV